jgi:hypothetical protein
VQRAAELQQQGHAARRDQHHVKGAVVVFHRSCFKSDDAQSEFSFRPLFIGFGAYWLFCNHHF